MKQQRFVNGKHVYVDCGPRRARRFHRDGDMPPRSSAVKRPRTIEAVKDEK